MNNTAQLDIIVTTEFLTNESDASKKRFAFAYHIQITNLSPFPVTLRNRYWKIINSNNEVQEVQGKGVVGQEPRILPQETFSYTSGALLETPAGTMEGYYEFETDEQNMFTANIPTFTLIDPRQLH